MRSTRRPSNRLERTLVWILAGFVAVNLLLIVPAFASEVRLDRLHPSLPIVNLRPLAAGRARIADGLGEEFTAPVRALAGELRQAGAKALNSVLYENDSALSSQSGPTETPTLPSDSDNGEAGIVVVPSATATLVLNNDPDNTAEPTQKPSPTLTSNSGITPTTGLSSPTVDSLETAVVQTATALALPKKTKLPPATPTENPWESPTPTSEPATLAPSPTSTTAPTNTPLPPPKTKLPPPTSTEPPSNTSTPTSPPPTSVPSYTPTIAPSATHTSRPTNTAIPTAAPTEVPSQTPTWTLPPPSLTPVPDGNFYVATNGNDSNSGTKAEPFRTIARGLSVLNPGDTLYVRSGTYPESLDSFPSGTSWSNPITLAAYPGEVVTIKPSSGEKVLRFSYCRYIIVDGFILDGANVEDDVIKITWEAHHIRIQNSEIKGAPGQGVLVVSHGSINSDYNEFINLDIHDNGTSDFDHGIYLSTSHNLIDRSSIHHNAGWGVHIYEEGCSDCANDNVVSNNAIYDNARVGDRGPGIILSSGSGNLAYNNLVWGNGGGIQVDHGVAEAQVYNNVVYANDNYGIKVTSKSENAFIRNNIVYQNGGEAISDAGSGTIQDHNLVETDPQFVDASSHNFRLKQGSAAIDAGVALSIVTHDYDGVSRPRGAGFDIGAYESR